MRLCSVKECERKHLANGFCSKHNHRFIRHGSPTGGSTSPGAWRAWVDDQIVRSDDGCWVWPFAQNGTGYGVIGPNIGRKFSSRKAHRVVWEIIKGEAPPQGQDACHQCHNRLCVNPRHIEFGTRQRNVDECVAIGAKPVGEDCSYAKLTEEQAQWMLDSGLSASELSRVLPVSRRHAQRILSGERWAHLHKKEPAA